MPPGKDEWISREAAAALVGCKVSTIAYHVRQGHIEVRQRHGARPGISRTSVEKFIEKQRRNQPAAAGDSGSAGFASTVAVLDSIPQGHTSSADAADALGFTIKSIRRLVTMGELQAVRVKNRLWIDDNSLETLRQRQRDRAGFLSYAQAIALANCTEQQLRNAIKAGSVRQRLVSRDQPSLERASVERFAATLRR